jgi:hypothetical protein
MKTLTALRRAGYIREAALAKRIRARSVRHDWRIALRYGEEALPKARHMASWGQ